MTFFALFEFLFQGEENDGIPPKKYANAELMKLPNFLHLTPAHIKKHCAAIKREFLERCVDFPFFYLSLEQCLDAS